jgi:membrane protease YdiL (CAAX protease family)
VSTVAVVDRAPTRNVRFPTALWLPAVVGVVALLARPWFLPAGVEVEWRVAFFVALGAVGAAWPLAPARAERGARPALSLAVLAVGALAFLVGRLAVSTPLLPDALAVAIALNALAAVAEEAFFRRYLYGLLAPAHGTAVAVVVTAAVFALVHVTVWGWWVLPLDLAAGLLLSWQRAATGRWSIPAVTHVLANTLALL